MKVGREASLFERIEWWESGKQEVLVDSCGCKDCLFVLVWLRDVGGFGLAVGGFGCVGITSVVCGLAVGLGNGAGVAVDVLLFM